MKNGPLIAQPGQVQATTGNIQVCAGRGRYKMSEDNGRIEEIEKKRRAADNCMEAFVAAPGPNNCRIRLLDMEVRPFLSFIFLTRSHGNSRYKREREGGCR